MLSAQRLFGALLSHGKHGVHMCWIFTYSRGTRGHIEVMSWQSWGGTTHLPEMG